MATPEENDHIDALHSNVQREVAERFEFESIYRAQMIFYRYYDWYKITESMAHWVENHLNNTSEKMTLYPDPIKLKK